MTAIQRFRSALEASGVDEQVRHQILEGYENLTDKAKKETRAAFFRQAMQRMDALLDADTCHAIRDACACSKTGWRLKAVQKIAREYADKSLEEKLQALRQTTHMGQPVLNPDGTITARIGDKGGFPCPCPVFDGLNPQGSVSITYCYCCAGHFRFHYGIALGKPLKTLNVESSALESGGKAPCRFVYQLVE